jgi:hypothetical protein
VAVTQPVSQVQWIQALRDFIATCRAARPTPAPTAAALGPRAYEEYRRTGGYLQRLVHEHVQEFVTTRRVMPILDVAPDPVIVFHGDAATLAACDVLFDGGIISKDRYAAMLDDEYRYFMAANPEPNEFRYHISSWSSFRDADAETLARARSLGHSLDPALQHRAHVTGTLWAQRCGAGLDHLWAWDGTNLRLIQEAIRSVQY